MTNPPIWAQNNAIRTFALVAIDHEAMAQRVAGQFRDGITARRFRRAALAIKDARIIERRSDMLVGWQRALLVEEARDGVAASIGLTGYLPYWEPADWGYRKRPLNVLVHRHALARLFELAIQPLEAVAADLLSPTLTRYFASADLDQADCGFAVPFQSGRFVGSFEVARDIEGRAFSIFDIRSWIPKSLDTFVWTDKASGALLKSIEFDKQRNIQELLHNGRSAQWPTHRHPS